MKKETWKKVAAIGAAAVLCLSLFACGSAKSDDQAKKDTEEKKPGIRAAVGSVKHTASRGQVLFRRE